MIWISYSFTQPSLIASFFFVNFPGTNISINDEDIFQNTAFYCVYLWIPFCFKGKASFLSKTHPSITSSGTYLHWCPFSHYPNLFLSAHNAKTSGILKFLLLHKPPPHSSSFQHQTPHSPQFLTLQSFFLPCTTETALAKIDPSQPICVSVHHHWPTNLTRVLGQKSVVIGFSGVWMKKKLVMSFF